MTDVNVRIPLPRRETVRSTPLLRSARSLASGVWLDVTVPRVWIHEAVRVDPA